MLIGLRRHIKEENKKVRCWYLWGLGKGRVLMAFLNTCLHVNSVLPGIWGFCIAPEVLSGGSGRKSAGVFIRALGSPRAPALLRDVTVLCSWDLGAAWQGLTPWCSLPSFLHNLSDASATAQLQIQLLWATQWDRLAVVQVWKTAALQNWAAQEHPKNWTWGFSTAALHLFLLPGFFFASPNTTRSDYV